MCFQMPYQITFHSKSLGTFVALIFFPSVYFKMPYKMNILQKALSHSLHWHGSSPVWVHTCKSKIHRNISLCVIWYNLHSNDCLRVEWIAPISHWNIFLLWFIQDKFTFMLHWNNTQDISKYWYIQDFATMNPLEWPCLWYSFSTECVSKCFVRSLFLEKLWHNAWIYMVSLQNVFSNVI